MRRLGQGHSAAVDPNVMNLTNIDGAVGGPNLERASPLPFRGKAGLLQRDFDVTFTLGAWTEDPPISIVDPHVVDAGLAPLH